MCYYATTVIDNGFTRQISVRLSLNRRGPVGVEKAVGSVGGGNRPAGLERRLAGSEKAVGAGWRRRSVGVTPRPRGRRGSTRRPARLPWVARLSECGRTPDPKEGRGAADSLGGATARVEDNAQRNDVAGRHGGWWSAVSWTEDKRGNFE
jgi:hypothetical protein